MTVTFTWGNVYVVYKQTGLEIQTNHLASLLYSLLFCLQKTQQCWGYHENKKFWEKLIDFKDSHLLIPAKLTNIFLNLLTEFSLVYCVYFNTRKLSNYFQMFVPPTFFIFQHQNLSKCLIVLYLVHKTLSYPQFSPLPVSFIGNENW